MVVETEAIGWPFAWALPRRLLPFMSEKSTTIKEQRDGTVVDQFHIHIGLEDTFGDWNAGIGHSVGEDLIKAKGLFRRSGFGEAGASSFSTVTQKGELADGEHAAACLLDVEVHFARFILESSKANDFRGHPIRIGLRIALGHTE